MKHEQQKEQPYLASGDGLAAPESKPTSGYELQAVYEFRPLPGFFQGGEFRRYAGGEWIADDGEYDIAFISNWGAPICLYFAPSYQRNIIASWVDGHWSAREPRHPRGNAWHYALRPGTTDWGGDWGRDKHLNEKVGRLGMNKLCSEVRGANGRHVEPTSMADPHMLAGLVRNRDTKAILTLPHEPVCMYCGDVYRAKATGAAS
jgi:hypothetical protein